jgi:hypothetical protein
MKYLHGIFSIASLLVFVGCGDVMDPNWQDFDEQDAPTGEVALFPYESPQTWTYQETKNGTVTGVSRMHSLGASQFVFNNVNEQMLPIAWFNFADEVLYPFSLLYQTKNDGLWLMGGASDSDTLFAPSLYLKYPVHVGEEWSSYDIDYDLTAGKIVLVDTLTMRCSAYPVTVTHPTGSWSTVEYSYAKANRNYYLYYALNIGFVRYTVVENDVIIVEKNLIESSISVNSPTSDLY